MGAARPWSVLLGCLLLLSGLTGWAGVLEEWSGREADKPDLNNGKRLAALCAQCHDLTSEKRFNVGPYLWGIVQQPAGQVPGFKYSRKHIVKAKGLVWNEDNLDAYLRDPGKFIPGTITFAGIAKDKDRTDLIAYLKSLK